MGWPRELPRRRAPPWSSRSGRSSCCGGSLNHRRNPYKRRSRILSSMTDAQSPIEQAGFEEEGAEEYNVGAYGAYVKTGFPRPYRRYRLVYESQAASLEHTYFWVYNHAVQDMGFGDVVKTLDTFSASENSSFWGLTEQRKGIQQDKAAQYLQVIGRMTQDLFKLVREIRILKERL